MKLAALLVLVCACAFAPACGASSAARPDRSRWPVLKIQCDLPDATVWVGGRFVGQVRTLPGGMKLAPGKHRIEVRHDRHHTRYLEVTLAPSERKTVEVTLPEAFP